MAFNLLRGLFNVFRRERVLLRPRFVPKVPIRNRIPPRFPSNFRTGTRPPIRVLLRTGRISRITEAIPSNYSNALKSTPEGRVKYQQLYDVHDPVKMKPLFNPDLKDLFSQSQHRYVVSKLQDLEKRFHTKGYSDFQREHLYDKFQKQYNRKQISYFNQNNLPESPIDIPVTKQNRLNTSARGLRNIFRRFRTPSTLESPSNIRQGNIMRGRMRKARDIGLRKRLNNMSNNFNQYIVKNNPSVTTGPLQPLSTNSLSNRSATTLSNIPIVKLNKLPEYNPSRIPVKSNTPFKSSKPSPIELSSTSKIPVKKTPQKQDRTSTSRLSKDSMTSSKKTPQKQDSTLYKKPTKQSFSTSAADAKYSPYVSKLAYPKNVKVKLPSKPTFKSYLNEEATQLPKKISNIKTRKFFKNFKKQGGKLVSNLGRNYVNAQLYLPRSNANNN